MISKTLIFLLLPIAIFSFVDFGTKGTTYKIEEESIKKLVLDGISNLDKEMLRKTYLDSIEKAFVASVVLPVSKQDSNKTYTDYVLAAYNVPDPSNPGKLLFRKGQRIKSSIPDGVTLRMCFIDGNDAELAREVSREFGECDYLVANADIRKIEYLGKNPVFPMGKPYLKRFNIQSLPVKLVMFESKITKMHLDMRRIAEKVRGRKR